ncbi:MAG: hypothetical protein ACJ78Q_10485, partial [Chloroflexia bacterium]
QGEPETAPLKRYLGPFGALANPAIYLGALLTALLVVAAYQVRPTFDIPLGTATDAPLLRGFNAGEKIPGQEGLTFRWSSGDAAVTLQDIGRQDLDVTLTASGARPPGQPAPSLQVLVGNRSVLQERPSPDFTDYHFKVDRTEVRDGTLGLRLLANSFSPPGDPRDLGIIVTRIQVSPSANPDRFVEPPLGITAALTGASALLGVVLALLGWGMGGVLLGSSAVGLLAAWLLVADRLWLTTSRWYLSWLPVVAAGALIVLAVYLVGGWLLRAGRAPWSPWQRRALLTLILAVFAVRLAGQVHPQIFIVDLLFHAHRFETVESGQLLFTIESAEWGGHSTFYLPTPYIFMLPLNQLLGSELLTIKVFTVTLSTLGAFVVYYTLRRAAGDGRAGLIAAALYLTVPLAVLPFSWGITSNVFGEFFALCSFAIVVTCYRDLRPTHPAAWVLVFTLLMALLSHPGVVQLTLAAFGLMSLLALALGRIISGRRGAIWALALLILSFGVAYLIYYGHFAADMLNTLRQIQAEKAAQAKPGVFSLRIGGSVADRSLGLVVRAATSRLDWFFGGLRGFWQEAQAYYRVWPAAGALFGYLSIWPAGRYRGANRAMLDVAAGGWMLAVAFYAVIGWVMNLYVRYALFALPIVAMGAGILLSRLQSRGRSGGLVTGMLLLFYATEALALWHYRITYAFK